MIATAFLVSLFFFVVVCIYFFKYFFYDVERQNLRFIWAAEIWTIIIAPVIFLANFDYGQNNDCCTDSAVFSPEHRIGVYLLIALCVVAYLYSSYRTNIASPVMELLVNAVLLLALLFNILICIHLNTTEFGIILWFFGNMPIIMLLIMILSHNQKMINNALEEFPTPGNAFTAFIWRILQAKAFIKYPVLIIISLPVMLLLSLILFVIGQQPDTLIRAFTDTYKHGFSQLDYMCDNVECGGHYLCSVAANGHRHIVKPKRYGERNGNIIICNRQLLIANAFEELVQIHFPLFHKLIRKYYDKVGDVIHSNYNVFSNKFVSDSIYFIMKPLEWLFLITLYLFDRKPENRIARQYLSKPDKERLEGI